ncbi:MAG: GH1 family beta-glucosidase [Anaerolineae bacterium]
MPESQFLAFPADFLWGMATSSYQIEGAVTEDGRKPSIWDTFCRTPGKVYKGHTGDVAADHYHRYAEDVAIMAELGLKAYRFSIAWPRVVPEGSGAVNPKGLDFYERLIDLLLENHITPFVTLYHWDLPQVLEDAGGWPNRATAQHFADYVRVVADRLGDRVRHWITLNEPFVSAVLGHFTGQHAPGRTDPAATFAAGHHLLLAHGLAVEALRAALPQGAQVGITLDYSPMYPASDTEEDRAAAWRFDGIRNRLFFEPVLLGHYPQDMLELLGPLVPPHQPDDLTKMSAPLDFIGLNYYTRTVIRHDPAVPIINTAQIYPPGSEYSMMWESFPTGLHESLTRIWNDYHPAAIYITENGVPVPDDVDLDGNVRDYRRLRYVRDHIAQVHRAIQSGIDVRGYMHWSLLDNFEWGHGYRMRFGMVYVDFETQKRIIKHSGRWYAQVIRDNGLDPSPGGPFVPC